MQEETEISQTLDPSDLSALRNENPEFVSIPEDVVQVINEISETLKTEVLTIIERPSSQYKDALDQYQKDAVQVLLENTLSKRAISSRGIINSIKELGKVLNFDQIKNIFAILSRTKISVEKITNQALNGNRPKYYYYLLLKRKRRKIPLNVAFKNPFLDLTDSQEAAGILIIEHLLTKISITAFILREILIALKEALKLKKAVSTRYIIQQVYTVTGQIVSEVEILQSLNYANNLYGKKYEEEEFEIREVNGLIQLFVNGTPDSISQEPEYLRYDETKEYSEEVFGKIIDSIPDSLRHFSPNATYPAKEFLEYMARNRPTTTSKMISDFAQTNYPTNEGQILSFIRHVRDLNSLETEYSPLYFNIYGRHFYYLGKSKTKEYLPAIGDYGHYEKIPENSLYPIKSKFDFDLDHFIHIIEEKLPHLAYGNSDNATFTRVLSAYSAFGFKLSFHCLINLIVREKPEAKKSSVISMLGEFKREIAPILSNYGIELNQDDLGYFFETKGRSFDYGLPDFSSWPDFLDRMPGIDPPRFIEENEACFVKRTKIANDTPPRIRAVLLRRRENLPFKFTFTIGEKFIRVPDSGILNIEEKIQIINEVFYIADGKIKKKKSEPVKPLYKAILYMFLSSTLQGMALLTGQFAQIIQFKESIDYQNEIDLTYEFNKLKSVINSSKATPLKFSEIRLPAKVNGQNQAYYLSLKK